MMYAIDPTMSFAQVVQYYKDYVKRTKSCGRKPVSFLRFQPVGIDAVVV